METTNLQIPIRKDLKIAATEAALAQGFSSLQEAVRIFVSNLAQDMISVVFTPKAVKLSPKAIKRYNAIISEIDRGKNITQTKNLGELFNKLK